MLLTLCVALCASTRDRLSAPRAAHPSSAAVRSAWCLQFGAPGPPVAPPGLVQGNPPGVPSPGGGETVCSTLRRAAYTRPAYEQWTCVDGYERNAVP